MRTSLAPQPHLYMGDMQGRPLDAGKVYFGEPNKDPELYPINVYYDEALIIAALQPIRTMGGFMNANGQMVEIYAAETTYSVKVLDGYGRQVFYQAEMSSTSTSGSVSTRLPYPDAVERTQAEKNGDTVNVRDFGAVGDGVTDDTAAFQASANTGKSLVVPSGIYAIKDSIVFPKDMIVRFLDGAKVVANNGNYSKKYVFVASGVLMPIAKLSKPAVKGEAEFQLLSSASLSFDDLIVFYSTVDGSFTPFRDYHRAGEFVKVKSASGANIKTQQTLYDSYDSATTNMYLMQAIKVQLDDVRIESDGSAFGLIDITHARDSYIKNTELINKNYSCLNIAASIDFDITGGKCANLGKTSNDYGLVIGNSQNVTVTGGTYYARRHGINTGGAGFDGYVPCRGVTYNGCRISNDVASSTHAADLHGNTEYCGFYNCHISGGVGVRGINNDIVGNTVYSSTLSGACLYAGEIGGGFFKICGNTFHTNINPHLTGRGIIDFGGNSAAIDASTIYDTSIVFKNNTVVSSALSSASVIVKIANRGSLKKINLDCTDNTLQVNNMSAVAVIDGKSGVYASDYIIVDNNTTTCPTPVYSLLPSVGYHTLPVLRMQQNAWSSTVTTVTGQSTASAGNYLFKWKYPREPDAQCHTLKSTTQSGVVLFARMSFLTTDDGRMALTTTTPNKFAADAQVRISAVVYIRDV